MYDWETHTQIPEPTPTEVTKKERQVVKLMGRGKTMNEAVERAYNTTTKKSVYAISNKLRKRKRFLRYLDKQGLTSDLIVTRLVESLNAEKVEYDKLGNRHTSPHHMARIAGIDRALKLRGLTIEDQEKEVENNTPLVVRSIKFELGDHKVTIEKPRVNTDEKDSDIIDGETVESSEE